MTQILTGERLAQAKFLTCKNFIKDLDPEFKKPGLAILTNRKEKGNQVYLKQIKKQTQALGLELTVADVADYATLADMEALIETWNYDDNIHAIQVQSHLLPTSEQYALQQTVAPQKDIEGQHAINQGRLNLNQPTFLPVTAQAVLDLLTFYQVPVRGKQVTILGMSFIVGLPLAIKLSHLDATVSLCHRETSNLTPYLNQADLIISAMGQVGVLSAEDISKAAVLIDVATNLDSDGKLVGDFPYADLKDQVKAITPVPGGLGPVTVMTLMESVLQAYGLQNNLNLDRIRKEADNGR
ncbi:bifunctional 5,10-methylenetetrahydrofolate dehydrogenase/5,10-methenyltetrahydrofolate cyclohydrolase [Eremococcus coleocola]|uniref:bifunctional 5,10-methylenetetrahydrofolate dehydrogenase/5,10-methenyltetrahydrofolate cyclohydrolase n=1 Tax=Eremococcus coleocola TaxID=88132 RepID=UPI0003F8306C|nr:bifunctional 5,10-methylenetetrahydrofolate dehydrogenase/5,10-methenyltetrahydrofolate cyclohydrolase [Eremococcus coleocola]